MKTIKNAGVLDLSHLLYVDTLYLELAKDQGICLR